MVDLPSTEVEQGTPAKLSCVIENLTRKLDSVKWEKPNSGGVITDGTDGYKIDVGKWYDQSYTQISVLTVPASKVTSDSFYTCVIQSRELGITRKYEPALTVFGKCDECFYRVYCLADMDAAAVRCPTPP